MPGHLSDVETNNINLIRRFFKNVWNDKHIETIYELVSADCIARYEYASFVGVKNWKEQFFDSMVEAVPDVWIDIEDIISSDDRVVVSWKATGTHRGALLGVPPSNTIIDVRGTSWMRVADGLIVEMNSDWNMSFVLKDLLAEINLLRKLVPLCVFCKKVRNEKGYWEQVDVYLQKYAKIDVSHGLCLDCMKKEYPVAFVKISQEK